MRILSLQAERFKRLKAVSLTPTGNIVEISGQNSEGKSSTLDAIWAALGGKDAVPAKPINSGAPVDDKGAQHAEIKLVLGEAGEPKLTVTRRFKIKDGAPFTTDLTVETAEGARHSSPQGILDALVGSFCFDASFSDLKDEDQIKTLRKFVPDVDFAVLEGQNKRDFEERTIVNRRVKELRAQADGIVIPADAPTDLVDVSALEAKLAEASTHNTDIATRTANREAMAQSVLVSKNTAARLRQQAADLITQAEGHETSAADVQKKLDDAKPLPAPIDVADVQQKLLLGRQANAGAARAAEKADLISKADKAQAEADAFTKAIEDRKAAAEKAVTAAKMPIEGLGFGDGFVTLNGEPFSQASTAQQIRASVAIAAAMNPRLRVVRITDGALLDTKSWAALAEYAAEHDLQVFVETISPHTAAAVVIVDGGVQGAEQTSKEVGDVV